ncbi:MAG: hypothetical protein GX594_17540 [Pirellulaceae bacterium]|nr:hypothetical protein [Pirellulaceae bacterium]
MNRLTQDQFRDALRKGFGRAVLHVRDFGATGLEDDIAHACTTSLVYDAQCEGTRGEWLHEIVKLAGLVEMIAPLVVDKLRRSSTPEEFWDVGQLCVLASMFAQEGHKYSRDVLYDKFDRQEFSSTWLCGIPIMNVDGLQGFLYIAKVVGNSLCNEPDYWEDTYLLTEAYERFGRETVRDALAAQAKTCESTQKYLDYIQKVEQQKADRKNQGPRPLESVETVLATIEAALDKYPHRLKYWGRRASEGDVAVVFDRMLTESRPEQLRRYLCVFGLREMPRLAPQILELAIRAEGKLLDATIDALSVFQTTKVRNLGLRMFQETPPRLNAIKLFAKNYEPGDFALMESALTMEGDSDVLHRIGLDLLSVVSEAKAPELAGCLRWLYEYGPCSMCRENAVRYMVETKTIRQELIDECHWDCCDDTRELVKTISTKNNS